MELGFIGLGKMGMNMVIRLRRDQHRCLRSIERTDQTGRRPRMRGLFVTCRSGE